MNKLSKKYLKYMADNHKLSYSFADFQQLTPDKNQDEIIEALRFLKSNGNITYKSYDNLPAIIRLAASSNNVDNCKNNQQHGYSNPKPGKKDISVNWTALGVIVGILTLLFSVFQQFF